MQQANIFFIVSVVVALGALGAAGYFYTQYSSLQSEAKNLNQQLLQIQNEKTRIEMELAVLKATDLAKEAEVLTLKLTSAEKDLASTQKNLTTAEKARSDLATDLYRLKGNLAKIPAYLNAIDAMEDIAAQGPNQANVTMVDAKVALLKDDESSAAWAVRSKVSYELQMGTFQQAEASLNNIGGVQTEILSAHLSVANQDPFILVFQFPLYHHSPEPPPPLGRFDDEARPKP